MDKLWAPWRMAYFTQTKQKGCIFCTIYKQKEDEKNFVILRSPYCFAMLNTFPYNNGHTMIIPNRHLSSLTQLKDYEALGMHRILANLLCVFKKILKPDGFNVGINIGKVAGAGINKHVHVHLIPRWLGDTNFMPVTADTKVISQSLRDLYDKLKQHMT